MGEIMNVFFISAAIILAILLIFVLLLVAVTMSYGVYREVKTLWKKKIK